jgi:hypothetical protein
MGFTYKDVDYILVSSRQHTGECLAIATGM